MNLHKNESSIIYQHINTPKTKCLIYYLVCTNHTSFSLWASKGTKKGFYSKQLRVVLCSNARFHDVLIFFSQNERICRRIPIFGALTQLSLPFSWKRRIGGSKHSTCDGPTVQQAIRPKIILKLYIIIVSKY